jgi:hypothetical protein
MSDNVRLTDHDKVLAADEIGDAKHLRVKLQYGDNNSATDVSASNPLPVDIGGATVNINLPSGNLVTTISSGLMAVLSGRISVSSGEVHVMSGHVNAYIQSGNVNSYITSGNVYVNSGNINILNSGAVVSNTNPFPVTYIASGGSSTLPVSFVGGSTDAFGRLRVSNPFALFDSQHRYQINDKWNYVTSGGAATAYDTNGSLVNLNTNLASGSQVVCETKRVMPYQPGKSLLIYSTFTMTNVQANQRQRVGYFGAQNGIYFEMNGTTANFVLRSYITGSVVETRKSKGTWNVDNLDGTGPSGYNLSNFSNSLIFYTDIEWLGVGDVRVGFVLDGKYVHCHTFKNTPVGGSPISGTYMTTACLPLRYEITNTGTVTASGNLKQICNSVISEAGYEGFSRRYNLDLGTNAKRLVDDDVLYPIMSLRLASGRLDSVIVPSNLNAIVTSNQDIQYRIVLNPTLQSGTSWVTHYNGNVQYDISSTGILSGTGTNVIGGYINKMGSLDVSSINQFNFQLGRTINGVSDVFTVAMAAPSANTDVLADLSWFEIV